MILSIYLMAHNVLYPSLVMVVFPTHINCDIYLHRKLHYSIGADYWDIKCRNNDIDLIKNKTIINVLNKIRRVPCGYYIRTSLVLCNEMNRQYAVDRIIFIAHLFNRIHAMAPLTAPLFGLHILKGIFSLKNGTKIVLLIMRTSPFKGTCLFIYSIEVPFALYGTHLHCKPGQ